MVNVACRSNLDEPLVHAQTSMSQWKTPKVDLKGADTPMLHAEEDGTNDHPPRLEA